VQVEIARTANNQVFGPSARDEGNETKKRHNETCCSSRTISTWRKVRYIVDTDFFRGGSWTSSSGCVL